MKTPLKLLITGLTLLALATLNPLLSTAFAQGTAFTYQGKLASGGSAVSGVYDFTFAVWNAASGGAQQGATFATNAVPVTNGYFVVVLDFGGAFNGNARWLDIAVKTNAASSYSPLAPRQPLTPVPYAIMANSASNLLGTLPSTQVSGTIPASQLSGTFTGNVIGSATTATTATTANNFSGSLAGDVTGTQGATVVSTVGGSGAANIHAAEQLANAATSANTANAIVKRDAIGNFSAGTLTLSGSLKLPATPILLANSSTLLFVDDNINFYAGPSAGCFDAGYRNTGIGGEALEHNTSGSYNTANGYDALNWNTTGSDNTAVGVMAMFNPSGSRNTAIGEGALEFVLGNDNIAIGLSAGDAFGLGNYNIDIGNGGFSDDNQTIRIGTQGIQTNTFIAGIYGTTAGNGYTPVYVNSSGQLGRSTNVMVDTAGVNSGALLPGIVFGGPGNGEGIASTRTGTANLNGLDFYTSYNSRMSIANTGNVGIGKNNPATTLDVNGTVTATSFNGSGAGLTSLNAANLSGTFTGNVVGSATSATTATTANNFSGSLAGDVTGTQGATVVSTVGGSTAVNIHAAEQLANAATSAATAGTIVKRDGSGNFTGTSITLNGNLNLPATTASAGIIYVGGSPFIHAYGSQNFFAGAGAGNLSLTGDGNTGVGSLALNKITSGQYNTANGVGALYSNTNGHDNTANGLDALYSNTSGSQNIANGNDTLHYNLTGVGNTAVGYRALYSNTNGFYNIAIGISAFQQKTTGNHNIALGDSAGLNNIIGDNNIDIGNAGSASDTGIIRIGTQGTHTATYLAGNSVHVPGMLRLGSETNTASGPSYPSDGLVIRRISSTGQTVSNLLARTDMLMLTRDGTAAGLAINYSIAGAYNQNIVAIGIDNAGVQHIYKNTLVGPGSGTSTGTLFIFNNSLRIFHYDVSFGNVYNNGHTCHVILDRYDDGATSDNYMVGYLTSTYNQ